MTANLPRISIITTSYTIDRFKDIIELLDSIQAQSYKNFETILVADKAPALAEKIKSHTHQRGYSNISVLCNEGERGLSSARNLGIGQASGEIIAFVDDDAILFPNWAEETAKAYAEDSSIIGLTGPILPLWEDESMAWFPKEFYWIFSCTYWDWTRPTEVRNGYGTNISFRKEAFDQCGYFKTNLGVIGGWQGPGGEETEFSIRVKQKTHKRIVYHPNIVVKHKVYRYRLTNSFIQKRVYWEGYTKAMFTKVYRSDSEAVLSTEHELVRRIFSHLVPSSLKLLFSRPKIALSRLWVTIIVLACAAAGYLNYNLHNLRSSGRRP